MKASTQILHWILTAIVREPFYNNVDYKTFSTMFHYKTFSTMNIDLISDWQDVAPGKATHLKFLPSRPLFSSSNFLGYPVRNGNWIWRIYRLYCFVVCWLTWSYPTSWKNGLVFRMIIWVYWRSAFLKNWSRSDYRVIYGYYKRIFDSLVCWAELY